MNDFDHMIRHRPLAALKPTLDFGGKVQCALATRLEPKPEVLKVEPVRPFAASYPTFDQLKRILPPTFH